MTDEINLLIVDDEEKTRRILELNLNKRYRLHLAESGSAALELVRARPIDIVLTDLKMPDVDGQTVLREVKARGSSIPVIVMTAYGTIENAVTVIREGAFDYVVKPIDLDQLELVLDRAVGHVLLLRENERLRSKLMMAEGVPDIVTASLSMQQIIKLIQQIAPTDFTVLIQGETGTGKELVARAIHSLSPRVTKPFVAVNCGAIPRELLESEFFGSERGAFTGAVARRAGKFEQANGGTLFLDEVGEFPLDLQVKLLRVLEERAITRIGGNEKLELDFRIIAATNRRLEDEVAAGLFRADLYYRLNVMVCLLPPLRERVEDIPLLAQHFLVKHQGRAGKSLKGIDQRALAYLKSYHWPGNIRELENVMMRSIVSAGADFITIDDLPPDMNLKPSTQGGELPSTFEDFKRMKNEFKDEYLKQLEQTFLLEHLRRNTWNISQTARAVGMDRRLLQNMMKEHGLKASDETTRT
jgi:DNA-binding NtrC family response regulator